jgi:predicted TIM-barrel fold metal-dependent hydrolase
MPPSEYFKRNCWISVEADEETVPHFIETFGDGRLIFSTDYPHGDSKFPHAVDAFDKLPMTDATKAKVVSTNWSDLYKIPLNKMV